MLVETQTKAQTNYTLTILPDEYAENPREWDNLCTIVAFHSRYRMGDMTTLRHEDFDSWDEMEKHIRKSDVLFCLPVYMYEHSGIALSTSPFSCRWDSGQVGFIYVTKQHVRYCYGVDRITPSIKKKALEVAEVEVQTLSSYLEGDVWRFVIEDEEGDEVESCSGFYGYDSAEKEGQAVLNNLLNN